MRGYPFQKIFYQLTHVEDFSGLFLFLAGILLLVILIGIYFLIFKGLKHFVNKKIAGILSAVVLITGTVTMYHYNQDYITEAYNIIKEAARGISVRKTHMPENVHGKPTHFPKGSTAETILGEINSAKTSEELDVIKAKMEANPELKNKKEVLTKLQESAAAKKLEFDNVVANQKRKAEQAEKARQDREAMHAQAKAKRSERIRNGQDLTAQDRIAIRNSDEYKADIDFRNKNHPDKQLDYEGSPVESTIQPAPAPEAAKPATKAKSEGEIKSDNTGVSKSPAESIAQGTKQNEIENAHKYMWVRPEEVERIPDRPDQLKFDFMEEPVVTNSTKKTKGQGVMNENFWDRTMARLRANAEAEAKAQAKADAKAKERLLKEYGPEEEFEFNAKPRAKQAPKAGPVPEGASAAGQASTTPNSGAQASTGNSAKTIGGIDWGANGAAAARMVGNAARGIGNALAHPLNTTLRLIGGTALGGAAINEGTNAINHYFGDDQQVSTKDMLRHLFGGYIDKNFGTHFSEPTVVTPSITGENAPATGKEQAGTEAETAANEEQKPDKNPGTVVTNWLPESFKNISVNDYPVGGSLFGALAGGALGAGFGGLNYILTDENELSEEEKKKRSLARAMLSSAGIGAGIGGAIGGLDDWGRSSATPKKT